ncbi:MAG: hypothetical protein AAGH79_03610 [Bacteroidota bacterium]
MAIRLSLLVLIFLVFVPPTSQYAAIQLTSEEIVPPVDKRQLKRQKRLGKNRLKAQKRAQRKRIKARKLAWQKQADRRQIIDFILGILGILATIPLAILGGIAFPVYAHILYILAAAITLTVGIVFLIKGIDNLSLPGLNWERLRHVGIGWMIFLLGGLVFAIGLGIAIGFGFGGQATAANIAGIIGLLGGLTGLFFLIRGIVKAILN